MTDYSEAAEAASDALTSAADGLVEEYEIGPRGRRVKRGRVADQVKAAAFLNGLAARQSHGAMCRLSKPAEPK